MGVALNHNNEHTLDMLRKKIRGIESAGQGPRAVDLQVSSPAPVPPWMEEALDLGGLPRGAVTQVSNCPAALVSMLAALTAHGGCAAVVNHPNLAVAAVEAAGGDIERLVLVPDADPHAAAVLSTLVEGMDMVMYKPPLGEAGVSPTFARPVEARLNKSECALVVCGGQWPGARVHIDMHVSGIVGLGRGSGRVRAVEVDGRAWGKAQPPRRFHAHVGARWNDPAGYELAAPGDMGAGQQERIAR
ncbi:hypothetical protein F8377_01720 [Corynebacterium zhongnanshanii]|uniref:Uncharacterized protein n=2 Tax=Corynebacteriaceae TaxID=1653 RepID=A0ABQ6VEQ8_9CORY|nr:hypothetical protein F8377_01720 [Corynebacterium zhongnanshanii]